ncbi:MAG: energy-coupling factor ABC transporter substrate-binding protein [Candidatus Methanoplasma sp.]|jgi:cobalt transport protein|nr:energy-coupling factor ABC transporter substrate-binding protein [Candidatus Methanoplasma sp.]
MLMKKNHKYLYSAGFAVIALLIVCTLALGAGNNSEFGGSDDAGGEVIDKVSDDFGGPWWNGIFGDYELPEETESMLFALQAAAGAMIIGFFIGYVYHGKRDRKFGKHSEPEEKEE